MESEFSPGLICLVKDLSQNTRNRHLNVWLEDLVEEPLDAGEDESRDEKDVREVESKLSYRKSFRVF